MGYSIPQTNIQSTQETGLLAGLDELIEQSGREEILEMVIAVQANQIRTLQDQIDMFVGRDAGARTAPWFWMGRNGAC